MLNKNLVEPARRDRAEMVTRLIDFWLVACAIDYWGYLQGYLKFSSYQAMNFKTHTPQTQTYYLDYSATAALLAFALVAGFLAFRAGLSARFVVGQNNLFNLPEPQPRSKDIRRFQLDKAGFMIEAQPRSAGWSASLLGLVAIFSVGFISHLGAMVTLGIFALIAFAALPSRQIEFDSRESRVRFYLTYQGLHWYENIAVEPLTCVTLVLEPLANKSNRSAAYVVNVVTRDNQCLSLFLMASFSEDLEQAKQKAQSWSNQLGLPLVLPECGYLESKTGAWDLQPKRTAQAVDEGSESWASA